MKPNEIARQVATRTMIDLEPMPPDDGFDDATVAYRRAQVTGSWLRLFEDPRVLAKVHDTILNGEPKDAVAMLRLAAALCIPTPEPTATHKGGINSLVVVRPA